MSNMPRLSILYSVKSAQWLSKCVYSDLENVGTCIYVADRHLCEGHLVLDECCNETRAVVGINYTNTTRCDVQQMLSKYNSSATTTGAASDIDGIRWIDAEMFLRVVGRHHRLTSTAPNQSWNLAKYASGRWKAFVVILSLSLASTITNIYVQTTVKLLDGIIFTACTKYSANSSHQTRVDTILSLPHLTNRRLNLSTRFPITIKPEWRCIKPSMVRIWTMSFLTMWLKPCNFVSTFTWILFLLWFAYAWKVVSSLYGDLTEINVYLLTSAIFLNVSDRSRISMRCSKCSDAGVLGHINAIHRVFYRNSKFLSLC